MPALTPRERFLKERQRKQNLIFAVTTAVMAALVLLSLLVLTGLIPVPIGDEFSKATKYASAGTRPCPAGEAKPVDPASIRVQVLNTTSRQGLAASGTNLLKSVGYTPLEAGNASPEYAGTVEIDVGPAGVNEAYTVARFFPKSKVVLTEATDKTVSVLLGTFYDDSLSADDAKRISASQANLQAPSGCLPLSDEDEARALAPATSQSGAQSGAQSGGDAGDESGQ